jgi:hypothetical protein
MNLDFKAVGCEGVDCDQGPWGGSLIRNGISGSIKGGELVRQLTEY